MLDRRELVTQKLTIHTPTGKHSLYVAVGLRPDGHPGEVRLTMSHTGSDERAWADCFSIAVSLGIQCGLSIEEIAQQFIDVKFNPRGPVTGYDGIRFCLSPIDLAFQYLLKEYTDVD